MFALSYSFQLHCHDLAHEDQGLMVMFNSTSMSQPLIKGATFLPGAGVTVTGEFADVKVSPKKEYVGWLGGWVVGRLVWVGSGGWVVGWLVWVASGGWVVGWLDGWCGLGRVVEGLGGCCRLGQVAVRLGAGVVVCVGGRAMAHGPPYYPEQRVDVTPQPV